MYKTAIVIGASSGYGLGIAKALVERGYRVITAQRKRPENEALEFIHLDVTSEKSRLKFGNVINEYIPDINDLDVVVYSAGIAIGKSKIVDGLYENWEAVFNVNTLGLLWAIREFMPALEVGGEGNFIHIGSIANNINYSGASDYCAAKAASTSIMRTLRRETLGSGVRTTSIEPGLGNTNFQLERYFGNEEKAKKHYEGIKQLEPEDLGNTVTWLIDQPAHVNLDEIVIKPLDQVTHGLTIKDIK